MTGDWFSRSAYCWQNAAGYRIAAFRFGGGYRYSLFAPPVGEREHEERLKARYAKGSRVPQQRDLLGAFDDPAAARAAARHQSTQPAQGGDHGNADSDQQQIQTQERTGAGKRRGGEVEAAA